MNLFDFDGTLYLGDSTVDFYLFCLKKNARCLLSIPTYLLASIGCHLKHLDKACAKQRFYSFCRYVSIDKELLSEFWKDHKEKLNSAVVGLAKPGDVVISASPRFLLEPVCEDLGLELIASEVDRESGRCLSPNCKGKEKVRRFRTLFLDESVGNLYTDSKSDAPLAALASKAFLVHGSQIKDFPAKWKP